MSHDCRACDGIGKVACTLATCPHCDGEGACGCDGCGAPTFVEERLQRARRLYIATRAALRFLERGLVINATNELRSALASARGGTHAEHTSSIAGQRAPGED